MSDTIVAVATPPGRSAIAVVRVSGELSRKISNVLFRRKSIKPRFAYYSKLYSLEGEVLDDVIFVFYEAPKSYTGEDMLEIFCHGNPILARMIAREIVKLGARYAQPGEFTKRAFLNGKFDLIQSASINSLINATSEQALKVIRRRIEGYLSQNIESLKEEFLDLLKEMEARIDFEEDVPEISKSEVISRLRSLEGKLRRLLERSSSLENIVQGINVVILGKTNVGKSSLFNFLLGYERAIVSPIEGTTRDYISESITVDGFPVKLVDTAGIRETRDVVESIGISKTKEVSRQAELFVFVLSAEGITEQELKLLKELPKERTLVVLNKIDLKDTELNLDGYEVVRISLKTGKGLDDFRKRFSELIARSMSGEYYFTRSEYELIHTAYTEVVKALEVVEYEPLDIVSFHVRRALESISSILGIGDLPGEVLDRVFRDFCIGK